MATLAVSLFLVPPCLANEPNLAKGPIDIAFIVTVEENDPFDPRMNFDPQSPFYDQFNPPDPSQERRADTFVLIKRAADEYRFLRWLGAAIRNSEAVFDEYATRYRLKGNLVITGDGDDGVSTRKELQLGGNIQTRAQGRRQSTKAGFSWIPNSVSWNLGMDVVSSKISARLDIGRFIDLEAVVGRDTRLTCNVALPF